MLHWIFSEPCHPAWLLCQESLFSLLSDNGSVFPPSQQGFGGFTKVYDYIASDVVKKMYSVAYVIRPRTKDESACLRASL